MSHSTCTHRGRVNSRLLVIGSQIANLTLGLSFDHNLCCRCPNGSCKVIFNIYTSRPFQWYKEHFKARCFDPCNWALKFWESRRTPSSHFWECKSHPHTCFKVGLRQKLWPKEGPIIKLLIWFSTTKSQESPWITYVHVACYIPLKRYWRMLQFCFRPHLNQSFEKIIMSLQSCRSPNFRNCGTPKLGDLGQNDIWMQAPWPGTKNNIRGKVVAFPKSGPWWILWIYVCPWFICAPKMLQLHIN